MSCDGPICSGCGLLEQYCICETDTYSIVTAPVATDHFATPGFAEPSSFQSAWNPPAEPVISNGTRAWRRAMADLEHDA